MGIRAWTSETTSACAQLVSQVAHSCWTALARLVSFGSSADSEAKPEVDYRLDTELHTNNGRLSLDLDWNTSSSDATSLKERPKEAPETASRPAISHSQSYETIIRPDHDTSELVIAPPPAAAIAAPENPRPATPQAAAIPAPDNPKLATPQAAATPTPEKSKPATPIELNRNSAHLPEIVCFSDTPIPIEANVIGPSMQGIEQRNANERVSFLQTGLDFGSAVDIPSASSMSAQSPPGLYGPPSFPGLDSEPRTPPPRYQSSPVPSARTSFQYDPQRPSLQYGPQARMSFQYPQPRTSFQYPQPRTSFQYPQSRASFQSTHNPFNNGGPPSYRSPSPSPLPVYLQREILHDREG